MSAPLPPAATPARSTPVGAAGVRLVAFAVLVATFAAGVAFGWAGSRLSRRHELMDERRPPLRMGDRFLDHLDLTPAQRASIDGILERRRSQLDAFWSGPGRQLRLIVDSTRAEVRGVLTPVQRATYDSIGEQRHRRERERGGPPGFGPPGPPPP